MKEQKKPTKFQRVAEKDAIEMLEYLIKNFKDKMFPATSYEEDYAGGSRSFINEDVVKQLIKKLTR